MKPLPRRRRREGEQGVHRWREHLRPSSKRTQLLLIGAVCGVILLGGGATIWAFSRPNQVTGNFVAVPVELARSSAPEQLSIGVVVSLSSAPGEGSQWKEAANGAVVAAQRFAASGVTVQLLAADDHGTSDGATAAVNELAKRNVSGLVIATSGSHVAAATAAAHTHGLASILPYATNTTALNEHSWLSGPTEHQIDSALASTLHDASRVLLVDAGGGTPDGIDPAVILHFAVGQDIGAFTTAVTAELTGDKPADRILVTGSAEMQAAAVAALQAGSGTTPIVLTPEAQSPAFAPAVTAAKGTLSSQMSTVGVASGDASALENGENGRAMSAFLAGLRIAADDAHVTALFGDRPFSEVASAADSRSHDAVVALVRGAGAAGSAEPAALATTLSTLMLNASNGLVGPPLDFSRPTALTGAVLTLHASRQNLGLRAATATPPLLWFAGNEKKQGASQ